MAGWGSQRSMMSFSNEQLTPRVSGIVDNGHGTGVLRACAHLHIIQFYIHTYNIMKLLRMYVYTRSACIISLTHTIVMKNE